MTLTSKKRVNVTQSSTDAKTAFHFALAACPDEFDGMVSMYSASYFDEEIAIGLSGPSKVTDKRRAMTFIKKAVDVFSAVYCSPLELKQFGGDFNSHEGVKVRARNVAAFIHSRSEELGIDAYTGTCGAVEGEVAQATAAVDDVVQVLPEKKRNVFKINACHAKSKETVDRWLEELKAEQDGSTEMAAALECVKSIQA